MSGEVDHVVTGDVGGRLRIAREQRGLSLADVSQRTRLSIAVLQAIERNDFANLPGGMFRKAYVRTLSVEVGLDPNEMAAEYCAQFESPGEMPAVSTEAALEEKCLQQLTPSRRRSIITLAVFAVPAAAWFMFQPGRVSSRLPADHSANELPAAPVRGDALIIRAAEPSADAVKAIATASESATVPLRIEMEASGWCWVAAESDGERVMYRLIEPGERLTLEGQQLISLRLGDAGAVTLSVNDGPQRSLGRDGEVAELEVTLDNVESLSAGAAVAVSDAGP
jgi:cytoskeleton protein RodZ